jgi:Ser/Thr protein kinase RdoA (MazF antagonist)
MPALMEGPFATECLRSVYATPSAESVAELVRARYDVREIEACQFLNRGFNDTFALRGDASGYVARLSGQRRRVLADVAAETAFLAHLDAAGVPVAAAVPTREGSLFTEVTAPEGRRLMVLFRHANGRRPAPGAVEDARAQAVTLARIHQASGSWPDREDGRFRLDLEYLLRRPLRIVSDLPHVNGTTREYLAALATRMAASVATLDGLTFTGCHGDCHGGNAWIEDETATFFDQQAEFLRAWEADHLSPSLV